jgi:type IV secretion system protein VirB10
MSAATEKPNAPVQPIETRGKPLLGLRIGPKPAYAVIGLLVLVVLIIVYGVATRHQPWTRKPAVEDTKLVSAADIARQLTAGVSDAMPPRPAPEQPTMPANPEDASHQEQPPPVSAPLDDSPPEEAAAPLFSAPAPGQPPPSEEELARQQREQAREQARLDALKADTSVAAFTAKDTTPSAGLPSAGGLAGTGGGTSAPSPSLPGVEGLSEADPNKQIRKEQFLKNTEAITDSPYLGAVRQGPLSPYEIKATTMIPAVLLTAINSDLPGDVIAQVSETVYDSATGRYPLIPQFAKLYGTYDSQIAYGQGRVQVVWKRLIFPDSSTLELGNMVGVDQGGGAGFNDEVNNHYARLIGFGVLTSLFSAAFQLSQPARDDDDNTITAGQTAAGAVGQQMSQLGIEMTRKNLNLQPTLTIRPGYRFNVLVKKDILFPDIYKPLLVNK